ncbi:hypothetical protein D3C87_1871820 [compost metagenome]
MPAFQLEIGESVLPIVTAVGLCHRSTSSKRFRQRHDLRGKDVDIRIRDLSNGRAPHRLVFGRPHLRSQILGRESIERLRQDALDTTAIDQPGDKGRKLGSTG